MGIIMSIAPHDHTHHNHHCHVHSDDSIDGRIRHAKELCQASGGRFTTLREDIYRLILGAGRPLGAYDLINMLQQERIHTPESSTPKKSTNVAPPTVYRSLDFLLQFGLVHQLSSINAYIPCCHPRAEHAAAFLICQKCNRVQELSNPPISQMIEFSQNTLNFAVQKSMIELSGLCHDCQ